MFTSKQAFFLAPYISAPIKDLQRATKLLRPLSIINRAIIETFRGIFRYSMALILRDYGGRVARGD
jgi:hypothetical protein